MAKGADTVVFLGWRQQGEEGLWHHGAVVQGSVTSNISRGGPLERAHDQRVMCEVSDGSTVIEPGGPGLSRARIRKYVTEPVPGGPGLTRHWSVMSTRDQPLLIVKCH